MLARAGTGPALALVALAATAYVHAAQAGPSDELRFADELPTTLNPLFASTMSDVRAQALIFDRLTYRSAIHSETDTDLLKQNAQAPYTKLERLDAGRAVRVWVRDDVKWHDGLPFTADDICFTIDAMLANPGASIALPIRPPWVACRGEADGAVVITFDHVPLNPTDALSFAVLPRHAFPDGVVTRGTEFDRSPIGTGPMSGTYKRGGVVFTAVPNGNHAPRLPGLRLVPSPKDAVADLLAGELDGIIDVPSADRPSVAFSDDVALKSYDLRRWWFVAVNTHRGLLSEVRVREALDRSLDREQLRAGAVGEDPNDDNPPCEFVSGPFVQSSPFYNRAIRTPPHADREGARALLTAANADAMQLRLGVPASLERELPTLPGLIEQQLEATGFDVTVVHLADPDWRTRTSKDDLAGLDLVLGSWSDATTEDPTPLFHTRDEATHKGTRNWFDYSNPDVDALLDRADDARTDSDRRDAYHELHSALATDRPYLFLWKLDTKSGWSNRVGNNTISPYDYFRAFDGWRRAP